jgi:signal transduction histidine kinase
LHILNERLRELDRRKTEVISIVSHDLRTPLTSIIGFSDTLLNKELRFSEEDRERYIGIIRGESYRLARLISDFLVITKIEEGVFRILKTPTDLRDLIAETGRTMNLAPKAIKLKLALPDAPVLIEADRDKLLQVLHNLAGNAVKYCPENGTITIALKDTGTAVQVSVADTGPGIPDSEKERVFEKFYRRDDAVARKEAGSGLGLAIAKSIVDLHGGKISLRDAEGGGAEFSFELPRPPSV